MRTKGRVKEGWRANVWQTVRGDRFGIWEAEENMAMELLFKEKVIGVIDGLSKEDFWMYGKITLDENWSIRAGGKVKGIFLPAIYGNGDIALRYR